MVVGEKLTDIWRGWSDFLLEIFFINAPRCLMLLFPQERMSIFCSRGQRLDLQNIIISYVRIDATLFSILQIFGSMKYIGFTYQFVGVEIVEIGV